MPEQRRSRLKWLIIGLILAGLAGGLIAWAARGRQIDRERRDREAAEAREADLIVAVKTGREQIKRLVEKEDLLQREIQRIMETAPGEVETLIRWRTREVEVPVEKLVPGPERLVEVEVEGDCPLPERPRFVASGSVAEVVSDKGNLLAAGTVRLTRTHPPPLEVIFEEPWSAETTVQTTDLPDPEPERRKWGLWGAVAYDNPERLFVSQIETFVALNERTTWSGGVARRWGWGEIRAGVTDELAVGVGATFYPRRK